MARSDARRDGRVAVDAVCRLIHEHFDDVAYQRHARAIWNLEKSGCYADFARSAAFCRDGLKHAGLGRWQARSGPDAPMRGLGAVGLGSAAFERRRENGCHPFHRPARPLWLLGNVVPENKLKGEVHGDVVQQPIQQAQSKRIARRYAADEPHPPTPYAPQPLTRPSPRPEGLRWLPAEAGTPTSASALETNAGAPPPLAGVPPSGGSLPGASAPVQGFVRHSARCQAHRLVRILEHPTKRQRLLG